MSDGSNTSQKILLEPMRNIGAQDILKVGSTYEGVLRKRGGRMHSMFGSGKWKQRFVVISQGCMYCFKDEYANRPQSAFSLAVYESVQDSSVANVLHVFEVKHEDRSKPSQCFASETDAKRKTWIAFIQDAIAQTHQFSGGSQKLSADSDEGISIPQRRRTKLPAHLPPPPSIPGEQKSDGQYKHTSKSEYSLESDDAEEYSEICEPSEVAIGTTRTPKGAIGGVQVLPSIGVPKRTSTISRRPVCPLPPTPTELDSNSRKKPPHEETVVGDRVTIPNYINENIFKEEDFFFNSKDKADAHRILGDFIVGTFLVRLGNSTPTVLSVQTTLGIKEFQIAENEDGKVSINRTDYFPNLPTMLCFYNQNELPKKEYSVKLKKGYNS